MQWRHFWGGEFALDVEGAEIDPAIVRLGREHLGLPPPGTPGLAVAETDGRTWLAARDPARRFHLLVVDAYANDVYVPFHLATREFFALCAERLEDGGVIAMNVYAEGEDAPNLVAISRTFAEAFPGAWRSRRNEEEGWLLVARKGAAADPARLAPESARARFGDRPGVAEWDDLLDLAAEIRAGAEPVPHRTDAPLLTDDHAPIEWLTDRFLLEESRGREDLAAAHARLDRALLLIGAAFAAALLAAAIAIRRL
jgi:hypothetical protein